MLGLSEANKGFGYLPLAKSQHQASSRFIPSNSGFTLKGQPPARLKFISALLAFAGTLLLLSNTLSSDSHSPKSRAQPNSGWIAFDDRLDSPLVKRYINSAPITEQESRFSESCRDEWISRATLCSELRGGLLKKGLLSYNHSFEAVVTWQNGSDPTQIAGRDMAAADLSRGKSGTDPRHFRDHDELRASLRSLMKAYRRYPSAISRILLYTTDLPSDIPHQRIGSIPKWLNLRHASHALTKLEVVFPWQTFKTPSVDSVEEAEKWRSDALPTFQSMAVESQFSNLHVSEYLMYSCDDFFLFGDHSPSDVYTYLFGPTFRLRPFHETYKPVDPTVYRGSRKAEKLSLTNSAFTISKRFGERPHRYIEHVNKVFNKPLMLEMQSCFADALAEGAKVKLRGRGPDINIHSLFIHFVIERHREALLWSAIVAKADANQDGYLNLDEFQAFLKSLGVSGHKSWYKIAQPRRHIDTSKLLSEAGIDQPRQTRFDYTSQNGYALLLSDHQSMGIHHYPDYGKAGSGNFCTFDADHCFGGNWTTAPTNSTSDIFKHAAFEIPRCGDCIIAGLLGQSSKGLEAFLPPRSREGSSPQQRFATKANAGETPVLPTTARYEGVDFSLGSVLPAGDTAREFVTRLLLRYSYVMGTSKSRLVMLHNEFEARFQLGRILPPSAFMGLKGLFSPKNPSFVGINDDIERDEQAIDSMLHGWFDLHWPDALDWEV